MNWLILMRCLEVLAGGPTMEVVVGLKKALMCSWDRLFDGLG